jgi:putative FmdB family regulatory protein
VPTYQYVCTNPEGKHEFELVQSFTDAPPTECPVCGFPVRKVYGSVGVVFKGSGFYRTDSRAGASNGSSAKSSSDKGTSDKGSSGSSDKSSGDKGSSGSSGDKPASTSSSTTPSSGSGGSAKAAS